MVAAVREKFSSQAALEVLATIRKIAESESRQFQAVFDEALRDYIERKERACHAATSWTPSRKASAGTMNFIESLPSSNTLAS